MSTKSERSRYGNLKILQYDVHKSKQIVMASIIWHFSHPEPWQSIFTPTTHHPLNDSFRLYYPGLHNLENKARVWFFVNKRFKLEESRYYSTQAILRRWPPIYLYPAPPITSSISTYIASTTSPIPPTALYLMTLPLSYPKHLPSPPTRHTK